jgi:hypothetical protein
MSQERRWVMVDGTSTWPPRGRRTTGLPIPVDTDQRVVRDRRVFRTTIDERSRRAPEPFPKAFASGFHLKDDRVSAKREVLIRRVVSSDGTRSLLECGDDPARSRTTRDGN